MSDDSSDAAENKNILKSAKKWFDKVRRKNPAEEFEEDIMTMINEGHENGTIEDDEAEMITNIFALNDKEAVDIMIHRSQIVGIDASTTLGDALDFMLDENNSRFPVYEENIDHILGILHLKDAFRMNRIPENRTKAIKNIPDLVRDAFFCTETKKIDLLFKEMQTRKAQMAIVIDEYGQTAGLIAMEDILEEIVGNILDEYDEEDTHIEETSENHYIIDGMTLLEDLEEKFGIDFREKEFETINGFLISKLDKIPDENDELSVLVDGYCFQIHKVENHRIKEVLVYKTQPNENGKEIIQEN